MLLEDESEVESTLKVKVAISEGDTLQRRYVRVY